MDEVTPATDALAAVVRREGALVPSLWQWEIANVLLHAERRNRIGAGEAAQCLRLLGQMPIVIDDIDRDRTWRETFAIARLQRLTIYDAAYLELALRSGLPLATLDRDLAKACRAMGIETAP
ncbi:putative nucleic acid-binding protein [Kaistia dalseonensis]|uniref:Nucleic acid-binding protein n=2 Tax=Kaistia dalseonensis TaxID=410840 RepID=A0ABU0H5Z7_9HYPH|nr:putative nucleic acid-binding protein [Kaistia dalseonensis]